MSIAMPFTKMHGAGNDFVMVAGAELPDTGLTRRQIAALCDRRLGIGADGLIVVAAAADVDFAMRYYNADGNEATMCGNGARCAVAFAHRLGLAGNDCRFRTAAGVLDGRITRDGVDVSLPPCGDLQLGIDVADSPYPAHHSCDTGVPHLVIPTDDLDGVDVVGSGSRLRRHPRFGPAGTNVDWVEPDRETGIWSLRTYERGVEGETLACGTGAAAAAVVLVRLGLATSPVAIRTRSDDILHVDVGDDGANLRLRGPAVTVYHGEIVLNT